MNVFFDHQIFDAQVHGGISRYFYELIVRLPMLGVQSALGFQKTQNAYLLEDSSLHLGRSNTNLKMDIVSRGLRFLRRHLPQARRDAQLRSRGLETSAFEVFHPTYYDPYFLDRLNGRPFVLTVYDMIHETFPDQFASHDPVPAWKKKLAWAASHVLAISNKTKEDLIQFSGLPEARITVTHLGVSVPVRDTREEGNEKRHTDLARDTGLLFIGKRGGYKNFDRMLRACEPVLSRFRDLNLTCVGGGSFTPEEYRNISNLGLMERVVQVTASETELTYYYDNALIFIFPSLYEGFGLPLLEAFARGCPVAAARAGSLPEVAGDAAAFFDPGNESDMAEVLLSLVDSPKLRGAFVAKGFEQLKKYSWDRTAALTKQVYQAVCN